MGVKNHADDRKKVTANLDNPELDTKVTLTYLLGTVVQISALIALLYGMNILLPKLTETFTQPWLAPTAVCGFFAFLPCDRAYFPP